MIRKKKSQCSLFRKVRVQIDASHPFFFSILPTPKVKIAWQVYYSVTKIDKNDVTSRFSRGFHENSVYLLFIFTSKKISWEFIDKNPDFGNENNFKNIVDEPFYRVRLYLSDYSFISEIPRTRMYVYTNPYKKKKKTDPNSA